LKEISSSLKQSIAAAPELETLPKDVASLTQNVASMGSKITEVESSVKDLKTQRGGAEEESGKVKEQIKHLQTTVEELQNQSKSATVSSVVESYVKEEVGRLEDAIEELNSTVGGKVNWAVDDLHHHHERISSLMNITQNLSEAIDQLNTQTLPAIKQQLEQSSANSTVPSTDTADKKAIQDNIEQLQHLVSQLEQRQTAILGELQALRPTKPARNTTVQQPPLAAATSKP